MYTDEIAGIATAVLVTHDVIGKSTVGIGGETAKTVVVHLSNLESGIAYTLMGGSLEVGDGGGGVNIDTATLEIGAAYIVGAHLLASLMGLVVELESLGLVERHITTYAVEVAKIAHGLAMTLVGGLLIIFDSLDGVGF